eukprot:jgi/Bigna1/134610/aug1.26_g9318
MKMKMIHLALSELYSSGLTILLSSKLNVNTGINADRGRAEKGLELFESNMLQVSEHLQYTPLVLLVSLQPGSKRASVLGEEMEALSKEFSTLSNCVPDIVKCRSKDDYDSFDYREQQCTVCKIPGAACFQKIARTAEAKQPVFYNTIESVSGYYFNRTRWSEARARNRYVSKDNRSTIIIFQSSQPKCSNIEAFWPLADWVRDTASVKLGNLDEFQYDITSWAEQIRATAHGTLQDTMLSHMISLPSAWFLLFITVGPTSSIVLFLIPISLAASLVVLIPMQITYYRKYSHFALGLWVSIAIAMSVDYALFLLTRWREERLHGKDNLTAIAISLMNAGKTVLVSGLILAVSFLSVVFVENKSVQAVGVSCCVVNVMVIIISLTLVPATLVLLASPRCCTSRWKLLAHCRSTAKKHVAAMEGKLPCTTRFLQWILMDFEQQLLEKKEEEEGGGRVLLGGDEEDGLPSSLRILSTFSEYYDDDDDDDDREDCDRFIIGSPSEVVEVVAVNDNDDDVDDSSSSSSSSSMDQKDGYTKIEMKRFKPSPAGGDLDLPRTDDASSHNNNDDEEMIKTPSSTTLLLRGSSGRLLPRSSPTSPPVSSSVLSSLRRSDSYSIMDEIKEEEEEEEEEEERYGRSSSSSCCGSRQVVNDSKNVEPLSLARNASFCIYPEKTRLFHINEEDGENDDTEGGVDRRTAKEKKRKEKNDAIPINLQGDSDIVDIDEKRDCSDSDDATSPPSMKRARLVVPADSIWVKIAMLCRRRPLTIMMSMVLLGLPIALQTVRLRISISFEQLLLAQSSSVLTMHKLQAFGFNAGEINRHYLIMYMGEPVSLNNNNSSSSSNPIPPPTNTSSTPIFGGNSTLKNNSETASGTCMDDPAGVISSHSISSPPSPSKGGNWNCPSLLEAAALKLSKQYNVPMDVGRKLTCTYKPSEDNPGYSAVDFAFSDLCPKSCNATCDLEHNDTQANHHHHQQHQQQQLTRSDRSNNAASGHDDKQVFSTYFPCDDDPANWINHVTPCFIMPDREHFVCKRPSTANCAVLNFGLNVCHSNHIMHHSWKSNRGYMKNIWGHLCPHTCDLCPFEQRILNHNIFEVHEKLIEGMLRLATTKMGRNALRSLWYMDDRFIGYEESMRLLNETKPGFISNNTMAVAYRDHISLVKSNMGSAAVIELTPSWNSSVLRFHTTTYLLEDMMRYANFVCLG